MHYLRDDTGPVVRTVVCRGPAEPEPHPTVDVLQIIFLLLLVLLLVEPAWDEKIVPGLGGVRPAPQALFSPASSFSLALLVLTICILCIRYLYGTKETIFITLLLDILNSIFSLCLTLPTDILYLGRLVSRVYWTWQAAGGRARHTV